MPEAEPADAQTLSFRRGAAPRPAPEPPASRPENGESPETKTLVFRGSPRELAPEPPAPQPEVEAAPPGTTTLPARRRSSPTLPPPPAAPAPAPPVAPTPKPAPTAPAAPEPIGVPQACPRCGSKLISPESLGLCHACGYCRSLEEGLPPAAQHSVSLRDFIEVELLVRVLTATWMLWAGAALFLGASVAATYLLPPNSLERAIWSAAQLGLGLIVLLLGQMWALAMVAPHDATIGGKDLFLPFRLWVKTVLRLPETRWPVTLGGWGVTLIALALFLVGGLSYWIEGPPEDRPTTRTTASQGATVADRKLRDAAASLERESPRSPYAAAARDTANLNDRSARPARDLGKDDRRTTAHCVVIGYIPSPYDGTPVGLVLATLKDNRPIYAGVVRHGLPDARELLERFAPLEGEKAPLQNLSVQAVWVKPTVFCEVHHSGIEERGYLRDANFKGFLLAQ